MYFTFRLSCIVVHWFIWHCIAFPCNDSHDVALLGVVGVRYAWHSCGILCMVLILPMAWHGYVFLGIVSAGSVLNMACMALNGIQCLGWIGLA